MKKSHLFLLIISSLLMTGCSNNVTTPTNPPTSDNNSDQKEDPTPDLTPEPKPEPEPSPEPEPTPEPTPEPEPSPEPEPTPDQEPENPSVPEQKLNMKNIILRKVPNSYYNSASKRGNLTTFSYQTKNYTGNNSTITHNATIYLPYNYNQDDENTKYNILYLQHGAYGNERTWMYEYGNNFKNLIDNMIENEDIPPLIIVMPYLSSGSDWYASTVQVQYSKEIKDDLMPAVESYYHTYALNTTEEGFENSRSHRAFGGFSAGGTTTWHTFLEGINRFELFLPMSGAITLGGNSSAGVSDAKLAENIMRENNYQNLEYYVFAATGTNDVAYNGLSSFINYLKTLADYFTYSDKGFENGNLMYYTIEGNRHDYQYTYEYVYNGLRSLFSWYK